VTTRGVRASAEVVSLEDGADRFGSILELVSGRSKHDLASYKASTLRRGIDRRMGVQDLSPLASYEQFLRANPDELDLLSKEMLIGVTSFFRDPTIWQSLKERVLPALLARRAESARLRSWEQSGDSPSDGRSARRQERDRIPCRRREAASIGRRTS
jgi:two-component system, chemotaxis family, CheB/CheR fusion protein